MKYLFIILFFFTTPCLAQTEVVSFLHRQEFPIEVCDHKNNADISVSITTDTRQIPSCWVVERLTQANSHWRAGAYISPHSASDYLDMSVLELMGIMRADVYMNISAMGAALKTQGYNIDTPYTYDKVYPLVVEWFRWCTNGRIPSAVSFAGGNEALAPLIKDNFLTGRNSKPLTLTDIPFYNYGANDGVFLGKPQVSYSPLDSYYNNRNTTTRFWDVRNYIPGWTLDSLMNHVRIRLDSVIASRGWYQDFTHWHSLRTEGDILYYDTLMKTIDAELSAKGKTAWYGSAGEIAEYMAYRSSVTGLSCYERGDKVAVEVEVTNPTYQYCLNTPLSVKVDLSGSVLAGGDIQCQNAQLIKLGGDEWIINIPFRNSDTTNKKIMRVELTEGVQRYWTNTAPNISINRVGSTVTITSDVPVYGTVYTRAAGGNDRLWLKQNRFLNLSTTHTFTGNFTLYDYSFAAADPFNQRFSVVNILAP